MMKKNQIEHCQELLSRAGFLEAREPGKAGTDSRVLFTQRNGQESQIPGKGGDQSSRILRKRRSGGSGSGQ